MLVVAVAESRVAQSRRGQVADRARTLFVRRNGDNEQKAKTRDVKKSKLGKNGTTKMMTASCKINIFHNAS